MTTRSAASWAMTRKLDVFHASFVHGLDHKRTKSSGYNNPYPFLGQVIHHEGSGSARF